jgi:hypothetical protein
MAFQIKDETSGQDILYVDNSNQMGLGALPVNGEALTIGGTGILSPAAIFTGQLAVPGVPASMTGSVAIIPGTSSSVEIVYIQIPTCTSSQPATGVSTTSIVWTNTTTITITVTYAVW